MKQKDIALIMVVVFISAVISLFVSKAIFGSPQNRQQQEAVVQSITATFQQPSNQYFNPSAVDPTQLITIGQNANPNPFNGTSTDNTSSN